MITVSAKGEAKAAPDEARLSAGVVNEARSAAEALAANSRAMKQVFATLTRLGIPDRSIQTSDFSVSPQYAENRDSTRSPRITGYQVSNQVNVTVDDLAKLGGAIDALVASGANTLGNIAFTISNPKPLLERARADAMKDAGARARTYAAAGGFTLGPILAVNEGSAVVPETVRFAPQQMAAAVPVAGGEESVSANVSVTFEIQ